LVLLNQIPLVLVKHFKSIRLFTFCYKSRIINLCNYHKRTIGRQEVDIGKEFYKVKPFWKFLRFFIGSFLGNIRWPFPKERELLWLCQFFFQFGKVPPVNWEAKIFSLGHWLPFSIFNPGFSKGGKKRIGLRWFPIGQSFPILFGQCLGSF